MSKYPKKYNCFPSPKNKAKPFRMKKQKNDLFGLSHLRWCPTGQCGASIPPTEATARRAWEVSSMPTRLRAKANFVAAANVVGAKHLQAHFVGVCLAPTSPTTLALRPYGPTGRGSCS